MIATLVSFLFNAVVFILLLSSPMLAVWACVRLKRIFARSKIRAIGIIAISSVSLVAGGYAILRYGGIPLI